MNLIQTTFNYRLRHDPRQHRGSYLGRRPATIQTLRRWMRANSRQYGVRWDIQEITIISSSVSQWRYK